MPSNWNKQLLKDIYSKIIDLHSVNDRSGSKSFPRAVSANPGGNLIDRAGLTSSPTYKEKIKFITFSIPDDSKIMYFSLHRIHKRDAPEINNIDEFIYNKVTQKVSRRNPNEINGHHRRNFPKIPEKAQSCLINGISLYYIKTTK